MAMNKIICYRNQITAKNTHSAVYLTAFEGTKVRDGESLGADVEVGEFDGADDWDGLVLGSNEGISDGVVLGDPDGRALGYLLTDGVVDGSIDSEGLVDIDGCSVRKKGRYFRLVIGLCYVFG